MASITVIGPGAIGATVAARLCRVRRHTVTIATRTPIDRLRVDTGNRVIVASPEVLVDDSRAAPADWVMIATKAYDVETTVRWLPRLVAAHTVVAVLQNGVEHVPRFAPHVPESQLLPVVVHLPASRLSPGNVVQHGTAALTVPEGENARRFAGLFVGTGIAVNTTDDFLTAAWSKLALNAPGGVTAASLSPALDMSDQGTAEFVRRVVEEAIAVGRAEGARVDAELVEEVITRLVMTSSPHLNSLHADRVAGRPMEVDARNGAIVRIGERHGIPTPANRLLVDHLNAVQPRPRRTL